jgi:hypothetical protein
MRDDEKMASLYDCLAAELREKLAGGRRWRTSVDNATAPDDTGHDKKLPPTNAHPSSRR